MISDGDLRGWFVSIFFGICHIVSVATLLPNSFYLRISEKGFEVRSLFRSGFTNWQEVDQFGSGYIGPIKMVVFNYSQEHSKYEVGKKIAKIMAGVEGALPDTYGKSAEELAKLLNEWKEKFSKK